MAFFLGVPHAHFLSEKYLTIKGRVIQGFRPIASNATAARFFTLLSPSSLLKITCSLTTPHARGRGSWFYGFGFMVQIFEQAPRCFKLET